MARRARLWLLVAVAALALLSAADAVCPTVQYASGTRFSTQSWAAGATIRITAGQTYLFDLTNSPTYGVRALS